MIGFQKQIIKQSTVILANGLFPNHPIPLNILKKSDYILCEDTRVSKKLLSKYKIKSKLISNHKFNEKKNLQKIINILK